MAPQLFACRNAISDLRIAKNGWALVSDDPLLKEYFDIVSRNVRRARVRLTLDNYRGQMGSGTAPRDPAGDIINDPSDDGLPPIAPDEISPAQESFPALGPK